MAQPQHPQDGERLGTYRIGVVFEVSARDVVEARELVDQALIGDEPQGIQLVEHGQHVLDDGDVWGVLSWQQMPQGRRAPRPASMAAARALHPVTDLPCKEPHPQA